MNSEYQITDLAEQVKKFEPPYCIVGTLENKGFGTYNVKTKHFKWGNRLNHIEYNELAKLFILLCKSEAKEKAKKKLSSPRGAP